MQSRRSGLLIFGLMSFGALQYALLQGKKTHLQGREDRLIGLLNKNRAKGTPVPLSEQLRNYALVTHEGNLVHIHNLDGSLFFPAEGIGQDWALPVTTTARGRYSALLSSTNNPFLSCVT